MAYRRKAGCQHLYRWLIGKGLNSERRYEKLATDQQTGANWEPVIKAFQKWHRPTLFLQGRDALLKDITLPGRYQNLHGPEP